MRRLVFVLALLGATVVPGMAGAQEDVPPAGECPAGTMHDAGSPSAFGGVSCVCVNDVNVVVVSFGYGEQGEVIETQFNDVAGCPSERPPVPPEDCADAPPSCVPGEVLAEVVERAPVVPAPVGVAPAFTG